MSGYLWTALTPNVRGSIDTQPDGDAATKECGCDNRGGKWWLCQYHSGFHDAEQILTEMFGVSEPHPSTGSAVVLTVAHLDHTPENCDPTNLMAMCQACHLAYDRDHHADTRRITRQEQR